MITKTTFVAATIAAAFAFSPAALAGEVAKDEATAAATEIVVEDQSRQAFSLAAIQFELHLQSMGSTTGTRIHRDGPDLSRPVTVLHGDAARFTID